MIDYIIFSEFDINEGNVIKIEYPQKTGVSEMILSSYMIPEGSHNRKNDIFSFIINRNQSNDDIIVPQLRAVSSQIKASNNEKILYYNLSHLEYYNKTIKNNSFQLKEIYNLDESNNNQWISMKSLSKLSMDKTIYIKFDIDEKEKFYKMIIYSIKSKINLNDDIDEIFNIPIHTDINIKKVEGKSNFFSAKNANSQCLGFELNNEEDFKKIMELFNKENMLELKKYQVYSKSDENHINKIFTNSSEIINKEKDIYFLCTLETKLDKASKRGAILKSVAIGTTKLINLYSFCSLCKYLLEQSFLIHNLNNISQNEKLNKMNQIIDASYKAFNSLKYHFGTLINRYERMVYSYINNENYFTLPTTLKKEDLYLLNDNKVSIDLSLADNEEKIFPCNLIELISIFKDYTMTIYNAILNDQKIIFLGGPNTSCNKLSKFVFSTLGMIGVSSYGFIKRLHPYKNLYDLNFLNIHNCIYAVSNPLFKAKTDYWDVLCEIETGNIAVSENYEKISSSLNLESDKLFIKELRYKIKNEFISEYEVEKCFSNYTYHILKLCTNKYNFKDDDDLRNEINKQNSRKVKLSLMHIYKIENEYDNFKAFINYNGVNLKTIEGDILNLFNRKNIDMEVLNNIYNDIYKFILGGEFYINLFLALILTYSNDFQIFFNGLFCKNKGVKQNIRNIYNLLCESKNGYLIMGKLNFLYLLKLNELDEIEENTNHSLIDKEDDK